MKMVPVPGDPAGQMVRDEHLDLPLHPRADEMRAHIARLGEECNVKIVLEDNPNLVRAGLSDDSAVTLYVPDTGTEVGYWAALHEIGHSYRHQHPDELERQASEIRMIEPILGPIIGPGPFVTGDEARAWQWALDTSIIPLTEYAARDALGIRYLNENARIGMATYLRRPEWSFADEDIEEYGKLESRVKTLLAQNAEAA